MDINKDDVREIVSVFYQAPFKVFYINSEDGKTFSVPKGLFVSLGLTTPIEILNDIKNILNSTNGYTARLAELSSSRVCGQFINTITSKGPDEIKPYVLDFPKDSYDEEGTERLLHQLVDGCKNPDGTVQESGIKSLVDQIQKIRDLQHKINSSSGWDSSVIMKNGDSYSIFHKTSNYLQLPDDVSFRIGIYVERS